MKRIWTAVVLIFFIIAAGCNQQEDQGKHSSPDNLNIVQTKRDAAIDQTVANRAKRQVIQRDEVTEVHAVNSKKDLLVAVKLKTLATFNAQQLAEEITKQLEKQYPKHHIQVSSDKKIFNEVVELENQLSQGKAHRKTLEKKMKRIDSFMKQQDPAEAKKQK